MLALVAVLICAAGAVWFVTRDSGRPGTATPAVKFRRLPAACSFVPEQTIGRLVPGAETDHRPSERTNTQVLAFCYWNSTGSHKSLDVRVSAYVGRPGVSGLDLAKREMDDDRVKTVEDLHDHRYRGERLQDLTGPGDEGFGLYRDGAEIHMRVANVVFVLYYSALKGDAQALLRDARSAANDAVNALNSCITCSQ